MDLYYDTIARNLHAKQLDMIHHIPQPVMFGGKRTRNFVLAGNTDFNPSSLAVGYSGGSMLDAMYNESGDLASESLNGSGIFGKKFDRFVKKTIGKKATKSLYHVLDKEVKPLVNKGLDMGVDILGTAQPELIPALEIGKKMAKGYIDKPTAYQKNPSKMLIKDLNPVGLAKDYIRGEIESKLMPSAPAPPTGSGRKRGRPRKTTAKPSDYLDTVIASLKSSSKIEPVKKGRGRPRKGGAMLSSQTEQLIMPSYPKSLMKLQGKFKGGAQLLGADGHGVRAKIPPATKGGARSARAEIVKKVMSQKGLSMCDASKYVKQNNLY